LMQIAKIGPTDTAPHGKWTVEEKTLCGRAPLWVEDMKVTGFEDPVKACRICAKRWDKITAKWDAAK